MPPAQSIAVPSIKKINGIGTAFPTFSTVH